MKRGVTVWGVVRKAEYDNAHPVPKTLLGWLEAHVGKRCPTCERREWPTKFERSRLDHGIPGRTLRRGWDTLEYRHISCGASWFEDKDRTGAAP